MALWSFKLLSPQTIKVSISASQSSFQTSIPTLSTFQKAIIPLDWLAFEATLLQHSNLLRSKPRLPNSELKINHQESQANTSIRENPPIWKFQHRNPSTSLPWSNPSDSLQLFNSSFDETSTAINKWEKAIICYRTNPSRTWRKLLLHCQRMLI